MCIRKVFLIVVLLVVYNQCVDGDIDPYQRELVDTMALYFYSPYVIDGINVVYSGLFGYP